MSSWCVLSLQISRLNIKKLFKRQGRWARLERFGRQSQSPSERTTCFETSIFLMNLPPKYLPPPAYSPSANSSSPRNPSLMFLYLLLPFFQICHSACSNSKLFTLRKHILSRNFELFLCIPSFHSNCQLLNLILSEII